jgi:predicted transcriptional regulator
MPRVTVDLSDQMDGLVSKLAQDQNVPKAQVIRRAVALLSYLQDEQEKGGQVLIKNNDREKEVVFHSSV